ncbi:hypothetical protein COI_2083 [Mannheimia haemolytica serotype A2 str. OVINE]|nr:hypothetical protein MHH_c02250 [Mannheimia haemolytica M42548]EEY09303.1 hypothetical protein COI_2083 [Mannheimia haemolytica serotype A2 str. OVINE]EEY12446.1 hypothetical protein COK_1481 [Mannheimia haemolytica serotype A2 str. BOVINE]
MCQLLLLLGTKLIHKNRVAILRKKIRKSKSDFENFLKFAKNGKNTTACFNCD